MFRRICFSIVFIFSCLEASAVPENLSACVLEIRSALLRGRGHGATYNTSLNMLNCRDNVLTTADGNACIHPFDNDGVRAFYYDSSADGGDFTRYIIADGKQYRCEIPDSIRRGALELNVSNGRLAQPPIVRTDTGLLTGPNRGISCEEERSNLAPGFTSLFTNFLQDYPDHLRAELEYLRRQSQSTIMDARINGLIPEQITTNGEGPLTACYALVNRNQANVRTFQAHWTTLYNRTIGTESAPGTETVPSTTSVSY